MIYTGNFPFNHLLFIYQFLISFIVNQTDFMPQSGKPKICIILSENKPVLSSGSHHSIRLMAFLCNKIINKNPYISLGTVNYNSFFSLQFSCGINSRDQPLSRRFFISGTSIKLSAAEKSFNYLKFQCTFQLPGVNAVIFNCVGISYNFRMLQSGYTSVHCILNIFRKRTGHTSHIHFICRKPFRFYEHLMPVLIREFHNLIFY